MRALFVILPACAALAIAACSGGAEQISEEAQSNAVGDSGSPDDEIDNREGISETLNAMPEAFWGVWNFAVEDCGSELSEGRLVVSANEVQFYESAARLSDITRTGTNAVTAVHNFSGEGEEWTETLSHEINDDGDRLSIGSTDGSVSIRMRCP